MSTIIRQFTHNGGKSITAGTPQYFGGPWSPSKARDPNDPTPFKGKVYVDGYTPPRDPLPSLVPRKDDRSRWYTPEYSAWLQQEDVKRRAKAAKLAEIQRTAHLPKTLIEAERRRQQEMTAQGWKWRGLTGGWVPPHKNATYTPSEWAGKSYIAQPWEVSSYSLGPRGANGSPIINKPKFGNRYEKQTSMWEQRAKESKARFASYNKPSNFFKGLF